MFTYGRLADTTADGKAEGHESERCREIFHPHNVDDEHGNQRHEAARKYADDCRVHGEEIVACEKRCYEAKHGRYQHTNDEDGPSLNEFTVRNPAEEYSCEHLADAKYGERQCHVEAVIA